ncbi:MAG TPA: MerR family DNA-binding transcriptional regulator [Burkholderiales bacterium]|nr:MerR family DNA-binding transcriptional regulator [Burkholderiales bacterium]
MAQWYTIRQLMDEFDVTARTLRHYEEVGLLQPARRGTARTFSARDRARLKVALRSKRVGFTLQEIRELFELYDSAAAGAPQLESFVEKLERKRAALEQQREDLDIVLNEIRFFSEQCRRMLHGGEGINREPTNSR